jgi:hypothetical protein
MCGCNKKKIAMFNHIQHQKRQQARQQQARQQARQQKKLEQKQNEEKQSNQLIPPPTFSPFKKNRRIQMMRIFAAINPRLHMRLKNRK